MTYVAIPDSDIDQDSPVKEGVLRQLRDNAEALAFPQVGAIPKIFSTASFLFSTATIAGSIGNTSTTAKSLLDRGVNVALPRYSFYPRFQLGENAQEWRIVGNSVNLNTSDNPCVRLQYTGIVLNQVRNFSMDIAYFQARPPIYGWSDLNDNVLLAEETITSEIMLGLGDLAPSIMEGAPGAPRIKRDRLNTAVASVAGSIAAVIDPGSVRVAGIQYARSSFMPMMYGSGTEGTIEHNPFTVITEFWPECGPNFDVGHVNNMRLYNGATSVVSYAFNNRYVVELPNSGSFNPVTPADLGPNAIIRDSGMAKIRDNTVTLPEMGGVNAVKVSPVALDMASTTLAGTVPGGYTMADITFQPYSFWPMFYTSLGEPSTNIKWMPPRMAFSPTGGVGTADQPKFRINPQAKHNSSAGYSYRIAYDYVQP